MGEGIKNPEFAECLKKNRVRRFSQGKNLVSKELSTAEKDLSEAKESLERGKYKWATIQAYYSMFHSARALLYNENYREKSHYCLIVGLKALYVETGRLPIQLIEELQKGKSLREGADYYDEWSQIGAKEMVDFAIRFLEAAKDILEK